MNRLFLAVALFASSGCGSTAPPAPVPVRALAEVAAPVAVEPEPVAIPDNHNSIFWVDIGTLRTSNEGNAVLNASRRFARGHMARLIDDENVDPFSAANDAVFSSEGFQWRWLMTARYDSDITTEFVEMMDVPLATGATPLPGSSVLAHLVAGNTLRTMSPEQQTNVPPAQRVIGRAQVTDLMPVVMSDDVVAWWHLSRPEIDAPHVPSELAATASLGAIPRGGMGYAVRVELRYSSTELARDALSAIAPVLDRIRTGGSLFGLGEVFETAELTLEERTVVFRAWPNDHEAGVIVGLALSQYGSIGS